MYYLIVFEVLYNSILIIISKPYIIFKKSYIQNETNIGNYKNGEKISSLAQLATVGAVLYYYFAFE